ncbi:DUF7927 domain-containing protein [Leifsonia sp. RAF41]|uniref:DUF7927 domain-containing protein n=1 Tax=Leifsonia sp. RAF41 TaxID=3233056 RepID=UPI003F98E7FE
MARRSTSRTVGRRRWGIVTVLACLAVGSATAALILPQYYSNAADTAVSTFYKTAVNLTNGSTAASADAPGGAVTGTAKPGDTLKWTLSYENKANDDAALSVLDFLANAGTYVPGSLELPPNPNPAGTLSPQYSTDDATDWKPGTPPATVTGVGLSGTLVPRGKQQRSLPFTAAPTVNLATTGGDAFNAVVHNGLVYAIYHHSGGRIVFCAQFNGATCPGWPTDSNVQQWSAAIGTPIGTGTSFAGVTASANGTWISGDRMYWYAGPSDATSAGLACLDLSTVTPTSCGYLPRSGPVVSNSFSAQIGGMGLPASDGNFYSASVSNGSASLTCLTPDGELCAGVGTLMSGVTSANVLSAAPFGDYVFITVQQTATTPWSTYCYNVKTGLCPGLWPRPSSPAAFPGGTPFVPVLSAAGVLTGVCTVTNGGGTSSSCWDLSGVSLSTNPYAGTGANFTAGYGSPGSPYVTGTKVYVSNGDQVMCRDFATYSGSGAVPSCVGFNNVPNAKNYTVMPVTELGPDCLVATADSGQIRFFSARTGGGCTNSVPQTVAVTPAAYYCGSGAESFRGWDTLTLPGIASAAYSSALITIRDQNGAVLAGYDNIRMAAGAELSLASIPSAVTSLTATVTLIDVTNAAVAAHAQISVSWKGDPLQLCFQTVVPPRACDAAPTGLWNQAWSILNSATGTDGPGGNGTGPVIFAVQADDSQCSLAVAKTSPQQSVRPGERAAFEITVRNTGSQAYDRAAFTDDLTDVLAEATYNGDHAASTGSVSYARPVLSWSGALAPGASATITYSATVISPDLGDHRLENTVVSPTRGNNCPPDTHDPACTVAVEVLVADLVWRKVDATGASNLLAGAAWTVTPVDDAGRPTAPDIVVPDCSEESAALCTGPDRDPMGGLFQLTGFGPGTYHLVETRAPVGFVLDPRPIPVTITAGTLTVTLPDVVNKQLPVPVIPLTGGLGSDLLTYSGAGVLAVVGSLALWQVVRRFRSAT